MQSAIRRQQRDGSVDDDIGGDWLRQPLSRDGPVTLKPAMVDQFSSTLSVLDESDLRVEDHVLTVRCSLRSDKPS